MAAQLWERAARRRAGRSTRPIARRRLRRRCASGCASDIHAPRAQVRRRASCCAARPGEELRVEPFLRYLRDKLQDAGRSLGRAPLSANTGSVRPRA